jgi:hypothetical protein
LYLAQSDINKKTIWKDRKPLRCKLCIFFLVRTL